MFDADGLQAAVEGIADAPLEDRNASLGVFPSASLRS